jgi:hypothetical protein
MSGYNNLFKIVTATASKQSYTICLTSTHKFTNQNVIVNFRFVFNFFII